MCAHRDSYQCVIIEIKALEFVDDIADVDSGSPQALCSDKIVTDFMEIKRLKFSIDKCKPLKISGGNSLTVYGKPVKVEETI